MKSIPDRYGIYGILIVGFLLRVWIIAQGTQVSSKNDDGEYFALAKQIFTNFNNYNRLFRPPLYPGLISLVWTVGGASWFPVGWIQALLDTTSIALIYGLGRTLFRRTKIAQLAALLYAIYPEWVSMVRLYYAETLFLFLSLFSVWLLLRAATTKTVSWGVWLVAGFAMALAALTREVMAGIALIVVPLWMVLIWRHSARIRWFAPLIFLSGVLLALAP
jgi:4-amino-4-deoxy-L-arabinose transferase-like glycosyltransferase